MMETVPGIWEVDDEGMIRLDGCPVFKLNGQIEVIAKDQDRKRSERRGTAYVAGNLFDLLRVVVERQIQIQS